MEMYIQAAFRNNLKERERDFNFQILQATRNILCETYFLYTSILYLSFIHEVRLKRFVSTYSGTDLDDTPFTCNVGV